MKVCSNLYNILCKAGNFVKKEAVLSASAILAAISVFFVPPDTAYAGYIDYRVIALLFCLMLVVAGLQQVGLFKALGSMLLKHAKNTRQLTFILVFLCFFCSMFITNDVSLLTFVPFAVMIPEPASDTCHSASDNSCQPRKHAHTCRQSAEPVSLFCFSYKHQ